VVFVELANGFELQCLTSGLQLLHDLHGAGEQDAVSVLDKCAADRLEGRASVGRLLQLYGHDRGRQVKRIIV
jgi:hypothetical protein